MKRFRDVVFSNTEPDDKNVVWVYPVPLEKGIYKVFIYNSAWEDVFSGQLVAVKKELIRLITENERQINSIKEELNGEEGITTQLSEAKNDISNLQSDVTNIQNTLGNEETGLIQKVNQHHIEIYGDGTLANPGLIEKVERIPDAMIIQGIETSVEAITSKPNPSVGDVYLLQHEDAQQNIYYEEYVYTSNQGWVNMGLVNNLDNYYTKTELNIHGLDKEKIGSSHGYTWDILLTSSNYIDPTGEAIKNNLFAPRSDEESSQMPSIINLATVLSLNYKCYIENVATLSVGNYGVAGKLNLYANNGYTAKISPLPTPNGHMTYYLPNPYNQGQETGTLALDEVATTSHRGLMSNTDKQHLDNLYDNIVPSLANDVSQVIGGNIPVGGIIMYNGNIASLPNNWHICDGTNGTPDLRDKFIVGAGNEYGINATGGVKKVKLKDYESGLPKHVHAIAEQSHAAGKGNEAAIGTDGKGFGHVYHYNDSGTASGMYYTSGAETEINSDGTISVARSYANTGKEAEVAHENRPPYVALYYIMRIA